MCAVPLIPFAYLKEDLLFPVYFFFLLEISNLNLLLLFSGVIGLFSQILHVASKPHHMNGSRAIILKGWSCWLRCKCSGAEY